MQEWIRLNRSFFRLNWFDKPEMLAVFMHLLDCASEEDKHESVLVQRGQVQTSLNLLTESTGISKKTIRTCLAKLKSWGLIEIDACNRYTIITVSNYDEYFEQPAAKEVRMNIDNPVKLPSAEKEKKPKKTKDELLVDTTKRKNKFYQQLVPYVETYGKAMIRQFFDYWSETNKSGSRMRFEQERTWNLNLRLQRWGRQQTGYSGKQSSTALHGSEDKDYNEGGW